VLLLSNKGLIVPWQGPSSSDGLSEYEFVIGLFPFSAGEGGEGSSNILDNNVRYYVQKHKRQQQNEQAKMSHSLQPFGLCPKAKSGGRPFHCPC